MFYFFFVVILCVFNVKIFLIFMGGSILYVLWVLYFLKKRERLDHQKFNELSILQSSLVQIVHGISEIKLNISQKKNRWK